MARRYSSSFGLQWNIADGEYVSNATAAPTIANWPGAAIEAAKSARINALTSGQSKGFNIPPGTLDMYGIGWLFRVATAPSAANTILRISGAAVYARVKLNADRTLELSDEDGVIGTSAGAVPLNTSTRINVLFDRSTGAGTHQVRLYVNGVEVVGSGARDISAQPNTLEFGGNRNGEAQTVGDWYFTCIKVNDNTGGVEDGIPGPGFLAYAFPVANGDANSGQSRGGADSGADWSQLSEVPPDDAGSYIQLNTATGVVWVKVTDPTTLGIGGAYIINLVQVGGRITLASAGAGNWFPSIKSQSGGVALDGGVVNLASATWFTHDDTAGAKIYKVTAYTDPQSGGAWGTSKLATMQIGAKTTDGNPATWISAVWAIIDFVPRDVVITTVLNGGIVAGLSLFTGGLQ